MLKLLDIAMILLLSVVDAFQSSRGLLHSGIKVRSRSFRSRSSVAAAASKKTIPATKRTTHPRNAFQGSYDMEKLCSVHPPLADYIATDITHRPTISFANPQAVRALNTALLRSDYNVQSWDLPEETLTPPVPGRADYIHTIADVLASSSAGRATTTIPTQSVLGIDIGTGASLIYPLIGTAAYPGWSFIGTDVHPASLQAAQRILDANAERPIELRYQPNPQHMLQGILASSDEIVDFVMCNPPFYASQEAFQRESERKVRNLERNQRRRRRGATTPKRHSNHSAAATAGSSNCRGVANELWYPGGEVAFVSRLIDESRLIGRRQCLWFSSLVSRRDHVPILQAKLRQVPEVRVLAVGQGNKSAVLLFWSFHTRKEQRAWADQRWK